MSDTATTETRGIGDNLGPSPDVELISLTLKNVEKIERGAHEYLRGEHTDLMRRLKEILDSVAAGVPSKIDDKVEAEKISDLRYAIKKWCSAAKAARSAEKKPWSSVANIFFAFFTRPIEDLEEIDDKQIAPVLQDWQDREVARQRREAEAEAQRQREISDAKAREAAEAEARRVAAERAEREAREAAEKAERDRVEEQRRQAEARARKEQEERDAAEAAKRAEAARREREEQDRLAAVAKAQRESDEAASAEARAREDAANAAAAEARKREQEADQQRQESEARARQAQIEEQEAKERAKAAHTAQKDAERGQIDARKDQRAATRDEKTLFGEAERAEKKADKHDDIVGAKAADLSRVRGEHGSVSSLREFWTFRNLNRAALDLEQLRQHIAETALETAIRSFIEAGGRKLPGVEIFHDTGTTTR